MDHSAFEAIAAARDSAYWTAATAIAAWVALFISAGGIALLAFQLKLTRDALRDSARSADAAAAAVRATLLASRPWVRVTTPSRFIEVIFSAETTDPIGFSVELVFENLGQTPAVKPSLDYCMADDLQTAPSAMGKLSAEQVSIGLQTIFPRETDGMTLGFNLAGSEVNDLAGQVLAIKFGYSSGAGDDRYQTPLLLLFHRVTDAHESSSPNTTRFKLFAFDDRGMHPT